MTGEPTAEAAFWNADGGEKWVAEHARLERLLRPVETRLTELLDPRPGDRVLDVGCGAGAPAARLAERVGPEGAVLGLDISRPLLAAARARADQLGLAQLAFQEADAQTAAAPQTTFDALISRFGVMFFADPAAAFRNLRAMLRPGGRLVFAAWAPPRENPWFVTPLRAAVARLGEIDKPPPGAPGPFAFQDLDHVRGILDAAGFAEIRAETESLTLPAADDAASGAAFAVTLGPAARVLTERGGDAADEAAVRADVARAFAAFQTPTGLRVPARVNFVTARNP